MVQLVAQGVSSDDMQVLSFHPGAIYTDAVKNSGVPKELVEWDDGMIASFTSFSSLCFASAPANDVFSESRRSLRRLGDF
jgi:hypothetical protein